MSNMPELLVPAGTMEKLVTAVRYGADAVYLGGPSFGLRAGAGNFTLDELPLALDHCHRHGVKAYLTLNSFLSNGDLEPFETMLRAIANLPFDAWIVSDPAAIAMARLIAPEIPLHLSTQANTTNWQSAAFWKTQGVSRVNLARETSLVELTETARRAGIECEVFVHGAMCISYSGRCLLSQALNNRNANKGACTHPCRWRYHLVEETRPGEYFPIEEHADGTFIFNSRDLCLIGQIPELVKSGACSLKIEGRMKSMYYVAAVTRVYRHALDAYRDDPEGWTVRHDWLDELSRFSHRGYTTGFFLGESGKAAQEYECDYIRTHRFVGVIQARRPDGQAVIAVRNRIHAGEPVELISPSMRDHRFILPEMERYFADSDEWRPVSSGHPNQLVAIPCPVPFNEGDLLRQEGYDQPEGCR